MVRRNGSVKNVRRDMLSSQIGKHTQRLVALGNTNVTVGLYFQGIISLLVEFTVIALLKWYCMFDIIVVDKGFKEEINQGGLAN